MDTRPSSPEILLGILATLNRLENRFESQSERLTDLEVCIQSRSSSPVGSPHAIPWNKHSERAERASSVFTDSGSRQFALGDYHASAYKDTVANLRKRFEFIDESLSELGKTRNAGGCEDDDYYSASIYSSRPLSRLELESLAVPNLQVATGGYGTTSSGCANAPILPPEAPAVLCDDTATPSTQSERSSSECLSPSSTAQTSLTGSWHKTQKVHSRLGPALQSIKTAVRRSASLRSSSTGDSRASKNVNDAVRVEILSHHGSRSVGDRFTHVVSVKENRAGTFLSWVSGKLAKLGRSMINQQFKMLDTRA